MLFSGAVLPQVLPYQDQVTCKCSNLADRARSFGTSKLGLPRVFRGAAAHALSLLRQVVRYSIQLHRNTSSNDILGGPAPQSAPCKAHA
jgi:hypothetical protein